MKVARGRKGLEGRYLALAKERSRLLRVVIEQTSTQSETARRLGMSRQYVSWLLLNQVTWEMARQIEDRLGLATGSLEPDDVEEV
jgi:transcriptional regulator with XRE-family HTH domain